MHMHRAAARRPTGDAPNLFPGSNSCFVFYSEFHHRKFLHSCTNHAGKASDAERIPCPGLRVPSDIRAPSRNANLQTNQVPRAAWRSLRTGPGRARSRGGGRGLAAFTLARDVRSRSTAPLPRHSRRTQLISSARPIRNHRLGAPGPRKGQDAWT